MKNIVLKSLSLKDFKGTKEKYIEFGDKTLISGENGKGKSTVMDAFMWAMFDKDSNDRKNFDIKPFNADGTVKHGLESVVTATLEIDGAVVTLEKTFKEKWTKQRGQAEKTFSGHETIYSINDIPVRKKEYEEKIKEICEEKLFKLVTNPNYFASLNWKDQRNIIQSIIGELTDKKVINYNSKLKALRIDNNDTVDNHRLRTQATIKKLKEQLKQIPTRIDELENSKVDVNVQQLENEKLNVQKQINELDGILEDSSKGNEILLSHKQRLFDLRAEYQEKINYHKLLLNKPLEHFKEELYNKSYEVQKVLFEQKDLERELEENKKETLRVEKEILEYESKLERLREEFRNVQKLEFELNENDTKCPTCNRELENLVEIIEDLKAKFNLRKVKDINILNENGKAIKEKNEKEKLKLKELKEKINKIENRLEEKNVQILEIEQQVKKIEKQIEDFTPGAVEFEGKTQLENEIKMTEDDINNFKIDDNRELKEKKKNLVNDLEDINKKLALFENNEKINERIEELGEEERNISINIARQEQNLFLYEEFIRTKVELSEGLINKKFKNIKFKLFNELINGGLEECCKIVIDGVPYSNANSASKINAGIEVINTLSEFYEVTAPVWIDNAESVNKISKTNSQLIELIVSKDEELKVEIE